MPRCGWAAGSGWAPASRSASGLGGRSPSASGCCAASRFLAPSRQPCSRGCTRMRPRWWSICGTSWTCRRTPPRCPARSWSAWTSCWSGRRASRASARSSSPAIDPTRSRAPVRRSVSATAASRMPFPCAAASAAGARWAIPSTRLATIRTRLRRSVSCRDSAFRSRLSRHGETYNATTDLLERNLAHPDRPAFRQDGRVTTYGALCERANRAGNALRALGVQVEQRVLLCMLDTPDLPAVFWGAMKAGLVPVPVNTLLTTADYDYLLRDSRARVLVVSAPLLPKLEPALREQPFLQSVVVAGGPAPGQVALDDLLAQARPELDPAPTSHDDVAFWLYSSGSTGQPKGAIHLHGDLAETAPLRRGHPRAAPGRRGVLRGQAVLR